MRKAATVILLLCLAFVAAEFKSYGQGFLDKLKLPKPPDPPAQHEQAGGVAQPTLPQSENASVAEPSVTEPPAVPSSTQQEATPVETQPAPPSNFVTSLESLNFHEGDFDWRKDWWKALLLTLGGLIAVTILVRIARQLFRYIVLTACLAAGSFGARYFAPPLTPWLESKLPSALLNTLPSIYWSYIVTFLVCYILATIVLFILKGPLDIMDKRQKCQSGKK